MIPGKPATRQKAIDALQRLGSRAAVERLRRFAESPPEAPESLSVGPGDPAFQLKVGALNALKEMAGSGIPPLTALLSMQDSQQISEELRFEAARAARAVDPIVWAEYQLERSDYGSAYDWLSRAQQSGGDVAYQLRVQNALARVHLRRGLVALANAEREPLSPAREAATSDLLASLRASEDPAYVRDAVDYGLRLGYLLHETVALRDPEAFEESYYVFVAVSRLAWKISREQGLRVDANKAEAALTIGRFNEAQEIARGVIADLERESPRTSARGQALEQARNRAQHEADPLCRAAAARRSPGPERSRRTCSPSTNGSPRPVSRTPGSTRARRSIWPLPPSRRRRGGQSATRSRASSQS